MKRSSFFVSLTLIAGLILSISLFFSPVKAGALQPLMVYIDGKQVKSEVPAQIINGTTMLPVRAVCEALGMEVKWDSLNYTVNITSPTVPADGTIYPADIDPATTILGDAIADSEQLRAVLKKNNPNAPDLVDLYLNIGREYGIRGDIAFCQAAKETGWWRYGGLVKPEQNNYCGLGATGRPATGDESLNGADPRRVWYLEGRHGAFFDSQATGVEAHIQHLYAYATKAPLPAGKELVDPRFNLVSRGIASTWSDLDGRWAVPGNGYGQSILNNYLKPALNYGAEPAVPVNQNDRIRQLELENQRLKQEIERLKSSRV